MTLALPIPLISDSTSQDHHHLHLSSGLFWRWVNVLRLLLVFVCCCLFCFVFKDSANFLLESSPEHRIPFRAHFSSFNTNIWQLHMCAFDYMLVIQFIRTHPSLQLKQEDFFPFFSFFSLFSQFWMLFVVLRCTALLIWLLVIQNWIHVWIFWFGSCLKLIFLCVCESACQSVCHLSAVQFVWTVCMVWLSAYFSFLSFFVLSWT